MSTTDHRAAYIEGLRQLADALEAHPGVPLPYSGQDGHSPLIMGFYGAPDEVRQAMATTVRALPCAFAKDVSDSGRWLNLTGALGGGLHIQLYTARDAVCTRRVTGVEDREVEEEVTPAVTRKVTQQVEVVEWDCSPILRPAEGATEYGPLRAGTL